MPKAQEWHAALQSLVPHKLSFWSKVRVSGTGTGNIKPVSLTVDCLSRTAFQVSGFWLIPLLSNLRRIMCVCFERAAHRFKTRQCSLPQIVFIGWSSPQRLSRFLQTVQPYPISPERYVYVHASPLNNCHCSPKHHKVYIPNIAVSSHLLNDESCGLSAVSA